MQTNTDTLLILSCIFFGMSLLGVSLEATAQDTTSPLRLSLKIGGEADTNAARREGTLAQRDVLTRYFLKAEHLSRTSRGQSLSLKWLSGGKLYKDSKEENTLLNQLSLRYQASPLLAWDQRWLFVYARGQLKDRSERGSSRDYLRVSTHTGLGLRWKKLSLSGGLGYSFFNFKPNARLSNEGASLETSLSMTWSDEWVSSISYSQASRAYTSLRFVQRPSGDVVSGQELRGDEVQSLSASTNYRGPVILGLSVNLLNVDSNSYGQSLQRYGVTFLGTSPLFWDVVLSLRVGLLRTFFADRIFIVDDTLSVDEENRNTVVVELERPLYESVNISARYSLYTQEFGASDVDYLRQLLFLGVGVEY